MKKKKPHYLKYYEEFMKTGELLHFGLCNSIPGIFKDETKIIVPTKKEKQSFTLSESYWASGLGWQDPNREREFTPLRQTVLLFCAAINGEL